VAIPRVRYRRTPSTNWLPDSTYGVSGIFGDPDGDGAHGLNEKKRISSVYRGRDFAYDLVKILLSEP